MHRGAIQTYWRAFGRSYTYNLRRNYYLWFGFLWGLPIPVVTLTLDLHLGPAGRSLLEVVRQHPVHLLFFAHPLLFALVFGAMGAVRHKLEEENDRLIHSLTELATTDPLTGLHNRRHVTGELEKALQRSRRTNHPFSVVLFDLDGFKQINDTQGHAAGDVVLKHASAALQGICREGDCLGRYGGDEFLLVAFGEPMEEASLPSRADQAVQKQAGLGVSVGIAHFPEDGVAGETLIAAADLRLAETKKRRYEQKGTSRLGPGPRKSALNAE